jgi:predicted TIM-barrel fold metal-dependent hydrolase
MRCCCRRCATRLDHAAYLMPDELDGAAGRFIAQAVARGNWWIKLSRFDHRMAPPYDTVVPLMQRLISLDPGRMIWATDWPHPLYEAASTHMPNDADLVDLLARAVPDARQREQILVENPARLFDFSS